ncbi:hypothetical protein GCM10010363_63030 [Streptomyces omiyaensis]|nr:hypothetical protein GCM10010363_63030 [Streptomyces omiyaensis]
MSTLRSGILRARCNSSSGGWGSWWREKKARSIESFQTTNPIRVRANIGPLMQLTGVALSPGRLAEKNRSFAMLIPNAQFSAVVRAFSMEFEGTAGRTSISPGEGERWTATKEL